MLVIISQGRTMRSLRASNSGKMLSRQILLPLWCQQV
jgi:hypothetical protein